MANEVKIVYVADASGLFKVTDEANRAVASVGSKPPVDAFRELEAAGKSATDQLKQMGITVDRSYAESRRNIRETAAEAVKASEAISAAQLSANRARNEFNRAVSSGRQTDNLFNGATVAGIPQGGTANTLRSISAETRQITQEAGKATNALKLLTTNIPGVGSLGAGLASGLIGGAVISEGIRFLKEIADAELEAYKQATLAQENLERASHDTGVSLTQQLESVDRLKGAYSSFSESAIKDLLAITTAAAQVGQSERDIRDRLGLGTGNPTGDLRKAIDDRRKVTTNNALAQELARIDQEELARLAQSQAITRGIRGERTAFQTFIGGSDRAANDAARNKAISEFFQGKTEPLTGLSDEAIQARFGAQQNKLPSELTEEEKRLARIFVLRQLSEAPDLGGSIAAVLNQAAVEAQERQIRNDFGGQQFQQIRDDAQRNFAESRAREAAEFAQQTERARGLFRDAKAEFADLASRIGQSNPFVKFAQDTAQSIEDIQTKFAGFGSGFVAMMLKIEAQTRATELAQLRYNSALSALKSNQEARRLDQAFIGITGPQTRELAVINATLANLNQGGDFRRRADLLERPFAARPDARRAFDQQLRELLAIDTNGAGRFGRESVADAVLNLTGRIDPRTLATSGDPIIRAAREAAINANRTKAASFTANLQDEIARRDAGQSIVRDAMEQLNLIQNAGLDRRAGIREFIATTGTLSENELTPELRRARANALRESARLEVGREDEGRKLQAEIAKRLAGIESALTNSGIKLHPDSVIPLSIDVTGDANDSALAPSLGATPAPTTAGFGFEGGSNRGF